MLLPLQGAYSLPMITQGDAQGYLLVAPSGRCIAGRQHTHGSYLLVAPSGRVFLADAYPQGDAQGYLLVAPSGRCIAGS